MPQKPKPRKTEDEKTVPTSYSRPRKFGEDFDKFIRDTAGKIEQDLSHSQVILALEQLAIENKTVYGLLIAKLKG